MSVDELLIADRLRRLGRDPAAHHLIDMALDLRETVPMGRPASNDQFLAIADWNTRSL